MAKVTDYKTILKSIPRNVIARACNCSTNYVSQVLSGYHEPSDSLRRRLQEFAVEQVPQQAPLLSGEPWSDISEKQLQKFESDMKTLPDENTVKIHAACQLCRAGHWEICRLFRDRSALDAELSRQGVGV